MMTYRPTNCLALILLVSSLRFVGLAKFVPVDEPVWLMRSANFYYALGQRDFEKTVYEYQPAVTTMWITTAALVTYFPDYRGQGQGYFTKIEQFNNFLSSFDKQPLELLRRSRLIALIINTFLLLFSFFLLRKYLDDRLAFFAILFVSIDPYFVGHSRILNHEAIMALLLLVSILGMMVYLGRIKNNVFLVVSGASAGLALLTKSSATVVIPFVGLMILEKMIEQWREKRKIRAALLNSIKAFLIWLITLILIYILLWPGMWVNPGKMLTEVYGNAFSYAFQGARLSITQELHPEVFSLETNGIVPYLKSLLWGTTPVTWLAVTLAMIGLFNRRTKLFKSEPKRVIFYFGILAIMFILLFGIARGRNSAHYILTSYLCLDIVAGIALAASVQGLATKNQILANQSVQNIILFSLLLIQSAITFAQYPYYYTYANPIMAWVNKGNINPNIGYGEGLELAGQYLSQKPNAEGLTAMSWYAVGPFSYFFKGKAYPLLSADRMGREAIIELKNSDYLVIYYVNQKRRNIPANLLTGLEGATPEHVIWKDGVEYIRIYKVDELPDTVFTMLE
jgi:4-amino-4-deoxy-L-arabinose transferase-like glycosyltransferase